MRSKLSLFMVPALLLAQAAPQLAVPRGTGVEIELLQDLSSETLQAGQTVPFELVRPIEVKGQTVFSARTPLTGKIAIVKSAAKWRKDGAIALTLDPLMAPDGSLVPIDFHRPQRKSEKAEKTGERAEATLFLAYYFPLIPIALIGASRKGKPFTIRKGERYLVYVIDPAQQPQFAPVETPKAIPPSPK